MNALWRDFQRRLRTSDLQLDGKAMGVRFLSALLVALCLLACRERPSAKETVPEIAVAAQSGRRMVFIGSPVAAATVWPPPSDAIVLSDTIRMKILVAGTGKPATLGNGVVLGISVAEYSRDGSVAFIKPFKVQAIDFAPPRWKTILMGARFGETRRAWISDEHGHTTVQDFQVQNFVMLKDRESR